MQTHRKIMEINSDTVTLTVPEELRHRKVEITIQPAAESALRTKGIEQGWPEGFFARYAGSLPDFPDIEFEGDFEDRASLE